MATLNNAGTAFGSFTPVSSALNGLPNGAGTIAALIKPGAAATACDFGGLVTGAGPTDWWHTLSTSITKLVDDDGLVFFNAGLPNFNPTTDWYITVVDWPAGGPALERFHWFDQSAPAGWTHTDSTSNNGGNRALSGTGIWRIGYIGDNSGAVAVGLMAAWAGTRLSDAQVTELSVNNKTSDWWNNSAGDPTLLIECNTLTPTDIGANPSTFNTIGGLTLTGATPTWTFDGQGAAAGTPDRRAMRRHSRGTSW